MHFSSHSQRDRTRRAALSFIGLMGIISLFSDLTHEGARSILGEFLHLTGARPSAIGFVAGFGELLGYGLRLISGRMADKSGHYWALVLFGYTVQVLAIPALALVPENGWVWACLLVILERIGKAIKKPAKNTLVSFAASEIGQGKGFAYQEFLDQLGAFLGPLMLYAISLLQGGSQLLSTYRLSFLVLGIPALLTIALTICCQRLYPHPETFVREQEAESSFRFRPSFLYYILAISLFALGFADFPLITYHAARSGFFPESTLSLLYALAMAVDAVAALFFGWLFDRIGIASLALSTLCSLSFSFFAFRGQSATAVLLGIVLWGIGMGAQESIMKAAVSTMIPRKMRSTGFGIFETCFGVAWFLGSWLMGLLYESDPALLVTFSMLTEALGVSAYALVIQAHRREEATEKKL